MQLANKNFIHGTIDSVEANAIPRGASSASLNWITEGNKISLRRGYLRLGSDAGTGKVTGLIVGTKADGTEIPFRTRARKVEYYNATTEDWVEIGTDILPVGADGLDIAFAKYSGLSGPEIHFNSPEAGPHKIKVANPGDYISLYDAAKNFKGYISIKQNRTFLWHRTGTGTVTDKTGLYGSYIDKDEATDFTQISAEAIGGSGTTRTGTLAFKAGGAKRNCLEVTFTDGTETFFDDLSGNLVGSAGGTGTINYTTGAYSVTFNAVAGGAVTATYRWEDSTATGICDFTKSATRTAGQGFIFRQDDGGSDMQNIMGIGGTEYCLHKSKSWALTLSNDDTEAANLLFRDRVGIPNFRAAVETADGVYYVDDTDENDPHFRLLTLNNLSTQVVPESISKRWKLNGEYVGVNLADYRFNMAAMIEFGDLIVIACRHKDSTTNNTVFTYNKKSRAIDKHDYYATCFAIYEGTLIAGDSVTNNCYTLFSGTDDDGVEIDNYWESKLDDLDSDRQKDVRRIMLQGEIGKEQEIKVYRSDDRGAYVEITDDDGETFIKGSGSYVDLTQSVNVGAETIGSSVVGGGSDGIIAYNYMRELKIKGDKFKEQNLKFVATKLGYASVSVYEFRDLRLKHSRIPNKYN